MRRLPRRQVQLLAKDLIVLLLGGLGIFLFLEFFLMAAQAIHDNASRLIQHGLILPGTPDLYFFDVPLQIETLSLGLGIVSTGYALQIKYKT